MFKLINTGDKQQMEKIKKNQIKEFIGDYKYITYGSGSDRYPYEIIGITPDNKQLIIRPMDSIRIDKNGMSECQKYEFKSNELYGLEYLRLYIPRNKDKKPALIRAKHKGTVEWYHKTYGLTHKPHMYYDYNY